MKIQGHKRFTALLFLLPLPLRGLWSLYRNLLAADVPENVFPLSILLGTILWCLLALLIVDISLYFSRTITLDEEGCCYSIWGFRRKLKWEDLTVQYCENRSPLFGLCAISPIYGPGILINVKGRTYNEIWTTDAYCLLFHPMTSVFLLFLPPMHEKWGSLRYLGYTVDKEELLAALKSFGQCLEVPEIQYRR